MADVVIVDNSDLVRELLGHALELQGYSVVRASLDDAPQAIRKANAPVVILDPGQIGSGGWSLLNRLRTLPKTAPCPQIIIVSDQSGREEVVRAAQLGVRDYMLKKRFSLPELITRVRRHIAPSATKETGKEQASKTPAGQTPVAPVSTPAATVAAVARPVERQSLSEERHAVLEAARELNLNLMTREQTLEKLESAPMKTLPGVVAELISLVNSPRGTVADIAQILRRDPVLTARILRVANSAGFATQRVRIATVEDGVKNIGVAGVRNLVVNVGVFDAFAGGATDPLRMTRVWQHCLGVALLMEKLAPHDASIPPGSAYLVGLCHDLSDIVLRQQFAQAYEAIDTLIQRCACLPRVAQAAVFGLPYAELMTQLLTRLRLPPLITLPIEEFFERGERRSAPGAGSLLGRSLRALNVYAHGLLLAPDVDEPITPLTRNECASTVGDATLTVADDQTLRGDALATASVLAGLTSEQTQQSCEQLIPQQPLRVGYVRDAEYARLDPLAAFLRLAAREVTMLPPLSSVKPQSLDNLDLLMIAGPRTSAAEVLPREMNSLRQLLGTRALQTIYFTGTAEATAPANLAKVTIRRLPVDINTLGQFLSQTAAAIKAAPKSMAA